jgi:hypothetical protein
MKATALRQRRQAPVVATIVPAGTVPFDWLTPKEAASRLRVSLRSFQEWDVPAHELPGNGCKGQPIKRYRTVDVDQWASRYFAGNGTLQALG